MAGFSVGETNYVLDHPGSVILSNLTYDIAMTHARTLSEENVPVKVIPETKPGLTEDQISLVCLIRSIKFPRKGVPEIAANWKKTFLDPTSYFQNLTKAGIRASWSINNSTDGIPPFARISLFNDNRERVALCTANKIDIVPPSERIFFWLDPSTIEKGAYKDVSLLVLGDVEKIPTDELSRNGVRTPAVTIDNTLTENTPTCPRCGSHSIQVLNKGFGTGKAVAGTLLLGPVGFAAGAIGSGNVQRVCANCKYIF